MKTLLVGALFGMVCLCQAQVQFRGQIDKYLAICALTNNAAYEWENAGDVADSSYLMWAGNSTYNFFFTDTLIGRVKWVRTYHYETQEDRAIANEAVLQAKDSIANKKAIVLERISESYETEYLAYRTKETRYEIRRALAKNNTELELTMITTYLRVRKDFAIEDY